MIRLRLLGPLVLEREDGTAVRSVLAQPKRFALLTYLAAAPPPAPRRRDTLLGLFWPEADEEHARTALRQALYQLRRSLGRGVLTGKGDEQVGVNSEQLWCDAVAFAAALEEGRLEEALELYRGPFLEGFHVSGVLEFERWAEGARSRLRRQAVSAAWELTERAEKAEEPAAARRWAERALELAPYDGGALRRYLSLMHRLGQPAAAVRAYETYAERLAEDLDIEPSEETAALVDRFRNGDRDPKEIRRRDERPASGDHRQPPGPAADRRVAADELRDASERTPPASARGEEHGRGAGPLPSSRRDRLRMVTIGALLGFVALGYVGVTALGVHGSSGEDALGIRSLAVLPLENLSGDPEQEYLTDGMTEALIAELGQIGALRVISRTSAMHYKGTDKRLPEIARELGVDGLLEGSMLRAGDRVRIMLRLVHGPTDRHVWSETWERDFRDVLALQDEVARGIARAVRADVSAEERERIDERPTEVAEAYGHYLQGNEYLRRESRKDWKMAEELYAKAVELDPGFARAWERLVYVRGLLGISTLDTARLAGARQALDRLRRLGRDRPETHAAEGWYAFWVEFDLDRASRQFKILRRHRPGDAEALRAMAMVHTRAARWEEAAVSLEKLIELDPRNAEVADKLARVLAALRRFDEAERYVDLALSLAPDNHFYYVTKWRVLALGHGDTARAGRLVEEAEGHTRQEELAWLRAIVEEFRRNFYAAIEGFRSWPEVSRTKYLFVSRLAAHEGETELARIHADSLEQIATDRLDRAIRLGNVPQMAVARYELGRVHAVRGRHQEAVREAEEGLRLMPLGTNSSAPSLAQGLVWIYARAGRHDEAVQLLERLLEVPGGETVHSLRLNPVYDALRNYAGFQALLREAGRV